MDFVQNTWSICNIYREKKGAMYCSPRQSPGCRKSDPRRVAAQRWQSTAEIQKIWCRWLSGFKHGDGWKWMQMGHLILPMNGHMLIRHFENKHGWFLCQVFRDLVESNINGRQRNTLGFSWDKDMFVCRFSSEQGQERIHWAHFCQTWIDSSQSVRNSGELSFVYSLG